ncbi:hypothetical protein H072_5256 [Dactylellina haptotyla CBS 200.50]|uniref:Potassium channel domain-containing protein n=1 Tax=Dactylellina haptotyla (strain CBS 200.50) TaxID=1284197 RepID=S8AD00_DACHA|nr:hypothetical protein H072_5256 [Dactylellina haptotyla CBS 200.50]
MNDPGLDDSVRELEQAQKQSSSKHLDSPGSNNNHFLSPNARLRDSRHNSDTSNGTAGNSIASKENAGLTQRPFRKSCFWERFSHDSREDGDEEIENARPKGSRNGSPLVNEERRSLDSRSPMREEGPKEADLEGGGKEDEKMRELNDISKKGQQDEQLPTFYFLFSTAFPLISATLGPVANVMSICALVVPWRVYIPDIPGASAENSDKIPDPAWCLALNAISLTCGFAANVILLLNLARRIQSSHLLPFTIVLWYIASLLLIALLAVYRQYLYQTPREEHAWSQAFYYAIIAAVLYFVIATLLVGNYIGILSGRYARQFTLTVAQRTLMLQTMSLMIWLCLGAGVFSKLEGWAFLDGIYFCDTTFLVVGLGDYTLTTNAGRALLFPYAAIGIVIIGLIVSSIRGLVLERGKRKVERRLLEKQREKIVDGGKNGSEIDLSSESEKEKFELMREAQDKADQRRKWMALWVSITFFLLFWMVGAFVFMESEHAQGWNYFQSLYFCFTTILTIGYGDFSPTSNSSKPFFVIWSLLAVPMMTILVSNLGDTIIVMIKNLTLWLGEWTVLPEEKIAELGGRNRWLKSERQKMKQQRLKRSETLKEKANRQQRDLAEEMGEPGEKEEKRELERIGTGLVEEEEQQEQHGYGDGPDAMKFLHHDLAIAIQELLPDLAGKATKQYTYEEWSNYIRLINTPTKSAREQSTPRINAPGMMAEKEGKETDWLGEDSPLMSRQSETEWLLTKLCSRLEECLREQKENARRDSKGKQRSGSALGSGIAGRSSGAGH